MNGFFEWLKSRKNWKLLIFVVITAFFVPLIFIHLLFKIPYLNDFLTPEWTAGELLGYVGAFYAFLGTAIFSCLALRQNERFKEENVRSQQKLSDFNERLLEIEKENSRLQVFPSLIYKISNIDPSAAAALIQFDSPRKEIKENGSFKFAIEIKNVGCGVALDLSVLQVKLCNNEGNQYISNYGIQKLEVNESTAFSFSLENDLLDSLSSISIYVYFAYTDMKGNYYEQYITVICSIQRSKGIIICTPKIDKDEISAPRFYPNKQIRQEVLDLLINDARH